MPEYGTSSFYKWTELKINIHYSHQVHYFREREIWWASLGVNIGHEQNGKHSKFERPVLVLKRFNRSMFWALPLTSVEKIKPFYFDLRPYGFRSQVIMSQLRLVSAKRLDRRIERIDKATFLAIKKSLSNLLNKSGP